MAGKTECVAERVPKASQRRTPTLSFSLVAGNSEPAPTRAPGITHGLAPPSRVPFSTESLRSPRDSDPRERPRRAPDSLARWPPHFASTRRGKVK